MKKRSRIPFSYKNTRLRIESLEDRRLLTAATDVLLQVNTSTGSKAGDAQLIFNGAQQISSYEIDSPSGQLAPANWKSLNSQGDSGWTTSSSTSTDIAEKDSAGSLTNSNVIDLGIIFTNSTTHDLTFKWTDQNNTSYISTVTYGVPVLSGTLQDLGSFQQGDSADFYTLNIKNTGTIATNGQLLVLDSLPAGLTLTSNAASQAGNGWTFLPNTGGGSFTAERSDPLAAGSSYPTLSIYFSVADNAPTSVTNTVALDGAGQSAIPTSNIQTSVVQKADLAIVLSHSPSFQQGDTADAYSIDVSNLGQASTSGTVTVTDTLPAGISFVSAQGGNWTTSVNGQTVTATQVNALAAGASYPALTITVGVAGNATSVTNTATVSGGSEINTANDSASDNTVITAPAPDMTVGLTDSGNFQEGDAVDSYTITVGNSGSQASSGLVTVTDTLPAGLTPTLVTGSGWTNPQIQGQTVTVTRSDSLGAYSNYPPLTIDVGVADNAAASLVNTATVAGGGELNTANDSATDTTVVAQVANLTVALTDQTPIVNTSVFRQGSSKGELYINLTNAGNAATTATVTVTDTLPAGLTETATTGAGWTFQVNGQTVTATRPSIPADSVAPGITITCTVANDAPPSVVESVQVSGGGAINTPFMSTETVVIGQTPTVSVSPVNITYGTALDNSQLSGTAQVTVSGATVNVPGTFTYTTAEGTVLSAGNGQTESVTFTPNDTTDYNTVTTATATVNVAPATPTVTANPINVAYGTALANSQLTGTAQATVDGATVTVPGTLTFTSAAGSVLSAGNGQIENVTFTPTDTADYAVATSTVTVNVAAATPTATVNPVNIAYGTALGNGQLSGTAQATVNGLTVNVPGTFAFATASGAVLFVGNGQTENVTFTPTDSTDYSAAATTATVNVAPATPTVVSVNPVNITYGAALANGQLSGTAQAIVNGATVSVPGTFAYTAAAGTVLTAGTGQTENITFTPTDGTDFATASSTVTVNVSQATPIVVSVDPVTIPVGTALDNAQLSGTVQWTVNGATISVPGSLTYTSADGAVLNIGVGQTELVTFTPVDNTDYATAASAVTVNVVNAQRQTPTIAVNPISITYGTALADSQLSGTAQVTLSGETVDVTGTYAFTSAEGTLLTAGSGQTESVTFTPTDILDYTTATGSVTVNVAQATPTVESVNPVNITYGVALANSQLSGTAQATVSGATVSVPGTFAYTTASGTVLGEGSGQLENVVFTPTDSTDFTTAASTVTINVAQATPTVTLNPLAITYGTVLANSQLTGTATSTAGGVSVNIPGTFTFTSNSGILLRGGDGQTESVTFTPNDSTDYTMATATVTINVAQAAPTISINPVSITYGTALVNAQLSGSAMWTVNGVSTSIPGTFSYTSAAGTVLSAGNNQDISATFTPEDTTDYATTTSTVTVGVAKATPTNASLNPVSISYGTALANSQLSGNFTWTVNGASVNVPGTLTFTTAAGQVLLAGSEQTENVTFTPTDTTDYNIVNTTVNVNVSLVLSPSSLATGTVGTAYSQTITASGGTSPYTFTVTSGALPAGVTLSPSGLLSGKPTAAGLANFTVTVDDAANPANTVSMPYQLTINAPPANTLAGYVYIDANNSGQRFTSTGQAKVGIPNVTLNVLTLSSSGTWVAVAGQSSVQTAQDGSYKFTGLTAGSYRVQIVQPANFVDGKDTAGKINGVTQGTAGTDEITVQLTSGQNATEYDFGQRGIQSSQITLSSLLSSAIGQAPQVVQKIQSVQASPQLSAKAVNAVLATPLLKKSTSTGSPSQSLSPAQNRW